MTIDEVKDRVRIIEATRGDDETAHSLEDRLHGEVLRAIADGIDNAQELATEALKTAQIDFCRWCA